METVYWHEPTKTYVKLKTFRGNNKLNTFIECNEQGETTLCKRSWSAKPQESQCCLIRGFSNLVTDKIIQVWKS